MSTTFETNCEKCTGRAYVSGDQGSWSVHHELSNIEQHAYTEQQRPASYSREKDLTLRLPLWRHPSFLWRSADYVNSRLLRVFWNRSDRPYSQPPLPLTKPLDENPGEGAELPWELREEVD